MDPILIILLLMYFLKNAKITVDLNKNDPNKY